jgi:hypothetical protein
MFIESCECDFLLFTCLSGIILNLAYSILELPNFSQFLLNHCIYFSHEISSFSLIGLSISQRHLVEGHHFHRQVGYRF